MEPALEDDYPARRARLFRLLDDLRSVAVAFSGGVDSAVLLHAARARLGAGAVGVIADSASLPRAELEEARALARSMGAELVLLSTPELEDPRYQANDARRCYYCKQALFEVLSAFCRARSLAHGAFGETADDRLLVRHGSEAAREAGIVAPLAEAGFTKADVRRYAREAGLSCAEKPASACLASRLPTGTVVTRARLSRVERAEGLVRARGFSVVRVRDLGSLGRLEVGEGELSRAEHCRIALAEDLEQAGFADFELAVYRAPAPLGAARAAGV
ncbi:MAG: TIGR00268 family protein [Planctomycetes bacterium]|nr:TIGR00268 family protein [Planctomycetota bacterium]